MILVTHIAIALISVAYSTYAFFNPSSNRLRASYALVAGTLLSGTYLVVAAHANMLSACVSGLVYTLCVSSVLWAANRKLAASKVRSDK